MLEHKNVDVRLGMIGCGNMGEAVLRRLLEATIVRSNQIIIATRTVERQRHLAQTYGANTGTTAEVYAQSNLIILAVKPQQFGDVPSADLPPDTVLLSLMAGISTATIGQRFKGALVVRAMPNLGFGLGKGVTGLFRAAEGNWNTRQTEIVRATMASGGMVVELQDETKLDAVTAVSGSGPAYFLSFAEQLVAAAHGLGFSRAQADAMVRQTFTGTASVLSTHSGGIAELRQQVTSKGGTTEAALKVFDEQGLEKVVNMAVKAACAQSMELSKD